QRLTVRQGERCITELGPDRSVDAVGVSRPRREQVHDEQVITAVQRLDRFLDERPQTVPGRFVARRNDLKQRDDAIAAGVANDECPAFEDVVVHLLFGSDPHPRRGNTDYCAALYDRRKISGVERSDKLSRLDIVVFWENPVVEGELDLCNPRHMKVMPGSGGNAGPIMNWHGESPKIIRCPPGIIISGESNPFSSSL